MRTRQSSPAAVSELHELAQLHGVALAYDDVTNRRREASPESLLRVLQVLGAPVQRMADVPAALRERRQARWQGGLEPVTLAWDDGPAELVVRFPARQAAGKMQATLRLEDGAEHRLDWDLDRLPAAEAAEVEGVAYVAKRLPLPAPLPWGYHRLTLDLPGATRETLVVSAPRRAYAPAAAAPTWGVFLPLYALHSARSWGAGDFADLERLQAWVHGQGGGLVATLPLTAAFLDEPFECSPYSPASRLFWNEFYLSVDAIPELARSPAAQAMLRSPEFTRELQALREQPLVDYRRQMALKRGVLAELATSFFQASSERRQAFDRFLAEHPQADDYARFRAVGERLRSPWPDWPAALRDGTIRDGDFDETARRYHLYVQWVADEQFRSLATKARQAGPGLYLDLPLGVNGHGYDVWRERSAFAVDASGGCPPDLVFTKGQDWGFPPMHPEGIRAQGYRYVIAYLRHQLKYAGVLRIDHMPVFHRLFWVPRGMEAKDGVYVRYPAEELYALFSLESHRHRTMLVGEDLGTVPPEVPESMAQHNVNRMYVVQYALTADPKAALPPVPAGAVASVNTHDMPPFAAFWDGADIRQRQELDLLGDQDPDREQEQRQAMLDALARFLQAHGQPVERTDAAAVLRACLTHLAASDARLVLLNLEDVWLETEAQNVPSTGGECPNWRRKARHTLEQILASPEVQQIAQQLDRAVRK